MAESMLNILAAGFVAWMIWSVLQPRCVFEIRVRGGHPRLRRGKVTRAFLVRVAEVCHDTGVARGWIGGMPHGRRIMLRFSRHFPAGARQRLRNEWLAAG